MYSTRHDNLFFHQIGVCENLQSGDSLFLGFQIGCGFYILLLYHDTAQMCHVLCKNKARFFSYYCCTISVLTLCTITQLFPIIRCSNIAFVFSKGPDGELLQHYIELGSEGRFHPSSNRLSELCSLSSFLCKIIGFFPNGNR